MVRQLVVIFGIVRKRRLPIADLRLHHRHTMPRCHRCRASYCEATFASSRIARCVTNQQRYIWGIRLIFNFTRPHSNQSLFTLQLLAYDELELSAQDQGLLMSPLANPFLISTTAP